MPQEEQYIAILYYYPHWLIEKGAVAAKGAIRKLPFEIRGSAADLFNASWPAVITFFGKAWESIKVVKEGLGMFLTGAWNSLEQAMGAVYPIVCRIFSPLPCVCVCVYLFNGRKAMQSMSLTHP